MDITETVTFKSLPSPCYRSEALRRQLEEVWPSVEEMSRQFAGQRQSSEGCGGCLFRFSCSFQCGGNRSSERWANRVGLSETQCAASPAATQPCRLRPLLRPDNSTSCRFWPPNPLDEEEDDPDALFWRRSLASLKPAHRLWIITRKPLNCVQLDPILFPPQIGC